MSPELDGFLTSLKHSNPADWKLIDRLNELKMFYPDTYAELCKLKNTSDVNKLMEVLRK
jgi:hypothetical protein